ncbi:hypothetical protein HPB50_013819 [Hyalomma asiaticum]|uniref:Uncharacterized protein n=3 Tax=Hyalomma asiaticum TaxID=266040 RepID=A0ACB7T6P6_HYAAI|nr:hypothetical protein HPB50_028987 [Hyalomma asiaticum]KAH6940569.1 hypothetical protein HPB50_001634 [Hyalomma asiaticum]KAH6940977.1 hypothetical protein HPB50_011541 [Hyalomma asiaticum]KAH6941118.1 hypothetical protein HPB50_013819 [Hyalomma asiaticum]
MAKDGKCRRNTGELQIQCDKCSRWAFLEETDFQSLQEADSGEFVYLCVTRSAFQEELEVVRAETVALRELVQHLQRQLRDLTTQFERGHSGFDSDQPNAHTDPLSESALTAVGDKTKGTGRELTQKTSQVVQKIDGAPATEQMDKVIEKALPNGSSNKAPEGTQSNPQASALPTKGGDGPSVQDATPRIGKEADPIEALTTESGAKLAPKIHATDCIVERQDKQKYRKLEGYHTEIIVCGDGNAPRIAKALQSKVTGEVNVKTLYKKGATLMTAIRLLRQHGEQMGQERRLVLFHAGVSDAIRNVQTEAALTGIHEEIARHRPGFFMCSVPEISIKGKEVQARAVLLNTTLKKLCANAGVKFVNLSKTLEEEGSWLGMAYTSVLKQEGE